MLLDAGVPSRAGAGQCSPHCRCQGRLRVAQRCVNDRQALQVIAQQRTHVGHGLGWCACSKESSNQPTKRRRCVNVQATCCGAVLAVCPAHARSGQADCRRSGRQRAAGSGQQAAGSRQSESSTCSRPAHYLLARGCTPGGAAAGSGWPARRRRGSGAAARQGRQTTPAPVHTRRQGCRCPRPARWTPPSAALPAGCPAGCEAGLTS